MARKKKKNWKWERLMTLDFWRDAAKWGFVGFLWVVIVTGMILAWYAADLPKIMNSPQFERKTAVTILDRKGGQIARYGELKGDSRSVDDLPPHLIDAVLAVEDRRFYKHFGIDPIGIARAFFVNLTNIGISQGGSTITQQLAKNLFLSHERTFKRKIQEAILAIWLEHELTKDEILSAYLNRVYLGAGSYGVEAAARTYYGKAAKNLTLYESAVIAGLLKAPSRYSPTNNPNLAAKRAKVVLAAMADAGYITQKEADSFKSDTPLPERKPEEGDNERYFTDWVVDEVNDITGTTEEDIVIRTTLDPQVQKVAEAALTRVLRENEDKNVTQGAVVVMDTTGAVLAMVGGKNYTASQFNRAVQSKRPPGSSFKPFVYLAALEQGWHREDLILDAPITQGRYRPANYGGDYANGDVSLGFALSRSLNTATIRLAQVVGIGNVLETAKLAGINEKLPREMSMSLGSQGVPMIEMVAAYATLAGEGRRASPYAIASVKTSGGTPVYNRMELTGRQPFDQGAVRELNSMLAMVIEEGTGRGARVPFPAAGKTGTSQDYRDAWFIGFSGNVVAGVWVGNDDNSSMKNITGGSLPAQIWREIMLTAHDKDSYYAYDPKNDAIESNDNDSGGGFSGMIDRLLSFNN